MKFPDGLLKAMRSAEQLELSGWAAPRCRIQFDIAETAGGTKSLHHWFLRHLAVESLCRCGANGIVVLEPLAAEMDSLLRCQPRPIGTAGTHRDPDGTPVDVFLYRDLIGIGH